MGGGSPVGIVLGEEFAGPVGVQDDLVDGQTVQGAARLGCRLGGGGRGQRGRGIDIRIKIRTLIGIGRVVVITIQIGIGIGIAIRICICSGELDVVLLLLLFLFLLILHTVGIYAWIGDEGGAVRTNGIRSRSEKTQSQEEQRQQQEEWRLPFRCRSHFAKCANSLVPYPGPLSRSVSVSVSVLLYPSPAFDGYFCFDIIYISRFLGRLLSLTLHICLRGPCRRRLKINAHTRTHLRTALTYLFLVSSTLYARRFLHFLDFWRAASSATNKFDMCARVERPDVCIQVSKFTVSNPPALRVRCGLSKCCGRQTKTEPTQWGERA